MVVDSGSILFFFGAGGSTEFGIPSMTKMAEDFKSIINQQNLQEQSTYNEIVEMQSDDLGDDVDIEAIFSVIDGLREYSIGNIGELSIYLSKKFFKDTLLHKITPSKIILESLEKDFQKFIRKSCTLKSPYREKMANAFTSFFNAVGEAVENMPSHATDVKYDDRWTFFTTNYDRCLEAYWRENVRVALDSGFRDKNGSFDGNGTLHPDHFLYTFGSELQALRNGRPGRLRLVKLHGSVTWLIRKDTGEIEEKPFDIDQGLDLGTGSMYTHEVVIYPLRQKQLYVDPYIQMFYCLNKELQHNRVWIVVGYSFRDPVIQNIFDINFKDGKRMILIHPHPEKVKERFPDRQDNIIAIEKYFGRDDDQEVINKNIKEVLKNYDVTNKSLCRC